jgi:hypothetical protein
LPHTGQSGIILPAAFGLGTFKTLNRLYVLGLRAFGTLAFREGDLLTFMQFLKSAAHNLRGVKEQVFCSAGVDKSKTFVSQSLDGAFRHVDFLKIELLDNHQSLQAAARLTFSGSF